MEEKSPLQGKLRQIFFFAAIAITMFAVLTWVNENHTQKTSSSSYSKVLQNSSFSSPLPSISTPNSHTCHNPLFTSNNHRFFARIGQSLGNGSPVGKKVEHYSIQKVTGDGRCLFRALVKGMTLNKGISLKSSDGRENADELRMAVKEVICDDQKERRQYEEALIAITVDESLKRYCQRIKHSDFWGGESELLVLSKLCSQPIVVYIPQHEHARSGWGHGFIPIAEYGAEFRKAQERENLEKL